jgi:hypothetical protein
MRELLETAKELTILPGMKEQNSVNLNSKYNNFSRLKIFVNYEI